MFYNVLGGVAGSTIADTHNENYALFSNIQTYYWSATSYYIRPSEIAWRFAFRFGEQGSGPKNSSNYAWAVHDGDVGAVPIPSAVWLFGSGLIGLVGIARRKKA